MTVSHTLFEEQFSIFVGINAIIQFVGDIVLEVLGYLPSRLDHLSLTFLNAFISFKTLSAIHKRNFAFVHEDIQIFWALEVCLVVGDFYYAIKTDWKEAFIFIRLTFITFSVINWIFATYIMCMSFFIFIYIYTDNN